MLLRRDQSLGRLALRGVLITLLVGAVTALPGIGLLLAGRWPAAAGLGAGLVASGVFLGAFTAARSYQAALVMATDAALDRRWMSRHRALASAGARWKALAGSSLMKPTAGRLLGLAARHPGQQHGDARPVVANPAGPPWSLTALLVLPVVMLERVNELVAVGRSRELSSTRWGRDARCRFCVCCGTVTALLASGALLVPGGMVLAPASDQRGQLVAGSTAVVIGAALAVAGWAGQHASRTVLAVTLFRHARDGHVRAPVDAATMARALAPAPILIQLLEASGALVAGTGQPIAARPRRPGHRPRP
jgi:hypothetical protein